LLEKIFRGGADEEVMIIGVAKVEQISRRAVTDRDGGVVELAGGEDNSIQPEEKGVVFSSFVIQTG
jgi:hypothetical protein